MNILGTYYVPMEENTICRAAFSGIVENTTELHKVKWQKS